jgi:hypothetical protein
MEAHTRFCGTLEGHSLNVLLREKYLPKVQREAKRIECSYGIRSVKAYGSGGKIKKRLFTL